ncbi:MAG: 2'-O-glycosyltransferase CruG [Nodosilinea sp.]
MQSLLAFPWLSFVGLLCLTLQLPMVMVLLVRLLPGALRRSALHPQIALPEQLGKVSVIVPTLNEANRLEPCLQGLTRQSYELREILIVDSRSTDGTQALVEAYQRLDSRIHLLTDEPLPQGWVGRPWALDYGFRHSSETSQWILGIDADTYPHPALASTLAQAMVAEGYDLVSLAPQFILKTPGEFWLQPALLMTLVYRFGAAGSRLDNPSRVMGNGQCFMVRRTLLEQLGGYQVAQSSFCDDVTLARYAAIQGAKVGFWDGCHLLRVRMYEGMGETWREWGRSLDLKDATSRTELWADVAFLALVQGLPWLLLLPLMALKLGLGQAPSLTLDLLLATNILLVAIRLGLQVAIVSAYDFEFPAARGQWAFWLSPLADVAAVVRIGLSAWQRPRQWRGRQYGSKSP